MALTRYNFSIQCKIKEGRIKSKPYMVGYFQNDSQAEAFRGQLQQLQANNGKVGMSKAMVEVANEELAVPYSATDILDVKVLCRYVNSSNTAIKSELVTVIIPNVSPEMTDSAITDLVTKMVVLDQANGENFVNTVLSITKTPHNVSTDTTTSEQGSPVQIGV